MCAAPEEAPHPCLHGVLAARRLPGYSGAFVFVATHDRRRWFVRKVAARPETSARLRKQMARQQAFADAVGRLLRTPRLLGDGESEGCFFFDMEHVNALDAASYLRQATYPMVKNFTDRLCCYLEEAARLPPIEDSSAGLFDALYGKVCQVQRARGDVRPETIANILLALERLRGIAERPTLCHGDLTLDNVLVSEDGDLWAVDHLNSPFDHYWQDVVKLQQDLCGGWYLRRANHIAPSVLAYVSKRLRSTAIRLGSRYDEVEALLLAVTFLRILPYTSSLGEADFVRDRLDYFSRLSQTTHEVRA